MSFSPDHSYIAPLSIKTRTAPGYRIGRHIDPQEYTSADLNQYLQNHELLRARAAEGRKELPEDVIRHKVKVYVYCSPCACQIATALDVCQFTEKSPFVTFHVRIDYRQATSCYAPSSSLDGVCSVIDHLKSIERTDDIQVSSYEIDRIRLIDRMWLEQEEYRAGELDEALEYSPESQITRIVNYHLDVANVAAIVILGEADYCVPLLNIHPFPSFEAGSRLRENMMFMLRRRYSPAGAWQWQRSYLASYSSKPPIIRNPSLPATVDKRQPEDPIGEKNKRPKTSIA